MPAGSRTIAIVRGTLDGHAGKTTAQVHEAIGKKVSHRAIRYALKSLHEDGLALRRGRLIFAAVIGVDEAAGPQKEFA
jgi:repressor of nif and glnA expression